MCIGSRKILERGRKSGEWVLEKGEEKVMMTVY